MGTSREPVGASWAPLGDSWGVIEEESSDFRFGLPLLGSSWSHIGALLSRLGSLSGRLGAPIEPFWAPGSLLGCPGAALGASWTVCNAVKAGKSYMLKMNVFPWIINDFGLWERSRECLWILQESVKAFSTDRLAIGGSLGSSRRCLGTLYRCCGIFPAPGLENGLRGHKIGPGGGPPKLL